MNIPRLPTDSLYKFLTLFGLILIFLYLYLEFTSYEDFSQKQMDLHFEIELVNQEVRNIKKKHSEHVEEAFTYCEDNPCCIALEKGEKGIKYRITGNNCNPEKIEESISEILKHDNNHEFDIQRKLQIIEVEGKKLT
ncbi:hypothetical protein FVB32_00995 [Flagellimonas hymeniacidonis]|uniref:Uncharacterized protein n=1 Tax=Flagellimonas hymeniacidonis TaxID=2603628 RepID=A0A5C8V4B2_9FLAO|nr:hypothetical protein [Flagellimonas hymeniacidonis]TXN36894.1 hypothetical protein FVB32_00995 [Flagellimonas hymeniacidonis]